jgi:RNA polymerase sigma-70 factor (ECF subfamily)
VSFQAGHHATHREIQSARAGDDRMLGYLLESSRTYLLAVAARGLGPDLLAKEGASDIVQETLLGAYRDFAKFHGDTREELLAWLRKILLRRLAAHRRRYRGTKKRRVAREVSCGVSENEGAWKELPSEESTPGVKVVRREQAEALLSALRRLPRDYRQVVVWRQYDGLSFDDIGRKLGRSPEAARKLWSRALIHLTEELGPSHDPRA